MIFSEEAIGMSSSGKSKHRGESRRTREGEGRQRSRRHHHRRRCSRFRSGRARRRKEKERKWQKEANKQKKHKHEKIIPTYTGKCKWIPKKDKVKKGEYKTGEQAGVRYVYLRTPRQTFNQVTPRRREIPQRNPRPPTFPPPGHKTCERFPFFHRYPTCHYTQARQPNSKANTSHASANTRLDSLTMPQKWAANRTHTHTPATVTLHTTHTLLTAYTTAEFQLRIAHSRHFQQNPQQLNSPRVLFPPRRQAIYRLTLLTKNNGATMLWPQYE